MGSSLTWTHSPCSTKPAWVGNGPNAPLPLPPLNESSNESLRCRGLGAGRFHRFNGNFRKTMESLARSPACRLGGAIYAPDFPIIRFNERASISGSPFMETPRAEPPKLTWGGCSPDVSMKRKPERTMGISGAQSPSLGRRLRGWTPDAQNCYGNPRLRAFFRFQIKLEVHKLSTNVAAMMLLFTPLPI